MFKNLTRNEINLIMWILGVIVYTGIVIVATIGVTLMVVSDSLKPTNVISAKEFSSLTLDEIDNVYNGKYMRITDASVIDVEIGSISNFVYTDVGVVFFTDSEDAFKVRKGETLTFIGKVSINNENEVSFHDADFIRVEELS